VIDIQLQDVKEPERFSLVDASDATPTIDLKNEAQFLASWPMTYFNCGSKIPHSLTTLQTAK
jgi:hypothetical protein